MTPLTLAAIRIRVPVPPEAVPWILGISLLVVVSLAIWLVRRGWRAVALILPAWKAWGFTAWGVIAVAWIVAGSLRAASAPGFSLPRLIVLDGVAAAVLAWSALLVWALRGRLDIGGALLAAAAYGLVAPLLSAVAAAVATGLAVFTGSFLVVASVGAAAFAAGLLGTVAVAVARVKPLWRAALVGLAAGTLVGTVARLAVQALLSPAPSRSATALLWCMVEGLILGGLGAASVRWLRLEGQTVGAVLTAARPRLSDAS